MNELLQQASNTPGGIVFSGATEEDLQKTNQLLCQNSFASLPEEYVSFLCLSDGLSYDGLELFGTKQHSRPQKNYIFDNIASINQSFIEFDFFVNKIIIGRMSEYLIVYNKTDKKYTIIDRVNLWTQTEFSTFVELLENLLYLCNIKNII